MDDPSDTATKSRERARPARVRYEEDLYSWAVEQARLLREGRIAQADAKNIAEELDDVGNAQYDKLESALRIILLHLLKWDYQPDRRSRSWQLSIAIQRKHVLRVLRKNPGLKSVADEAMIEAYETARLEAAVQTEMELETFPDDCSYEWAQVMERSINWPPGA